MAKAKKNFSTKVVITSYVLVILFTITCLVYQFIARESIETSLIAFFYGFCGTELLAIAGIKHTKLKNTPTTVVSSDTTCTVDETPTEATVGTEGENNG